MYKIWYSRIIVKVIYKIWYTYHRKSNIYKMADKSRFYQMFWSYDGAELSRMVQEKGMGKGNNPGSVEGSSSGAMRLFVPIFVGRGWFDLA